MSANSRLCGVVVTYQPDEHVYQNLTAMVAECGCVVWVDNGSPPDARAKLSRIPGIEAIALEENRGLATALNLGLQRALDLGCRWAVTFDQDSTPGRGMVDALRATATRLPAAAIVAPRIVEPNVGGSPYRWVRQHPRARWLFQRVACEAEDLPAITIAVSSGSLIELETWGRLGPFEDGLFIDYIDIDYCLRVIRGGRTVAVSAAAKLEHRLGARRSARVLGREFRPTHHSAIRHYYIARNRVRIWRRHARAVPHWALFDFSFAVYNASRVLAFEPGKWAKLKAMTLGTWDGLRGGSGPCPGNRARVLC